MGVTVLKTPGKLSKRLVKTGVLKPAMRKISKHLVSSGVKKIKKNIMPENAGLTKEVKQGDKTLRDSGALMSSIAPQFSNAWAAANTKLKYAKLMQRGGTVSGKGKDLWMPANAKTRQLMRKYNCQKPGDLITAMKGAGYYLWRQGKVMMARMKKGKPFALFVIKRSVKIPARPFLYIDEDDKKYINSLMSSAVKEALRK